MVGSPRPRRSGPRVSRRSTGRRGRTTVSSGAGAAVIARILARPSDNHEAPGTPRRSVEGGPAVGVHGPAGRSEEHTSELQSLRHLVCRLLLEKKKKKKTKNKNKQINERQI